ncbi:adhesion G protein-coupled receptor F5-like isoform X2 [Labrus mixtus]|uniref:adhesion G protein-coupled receptor F5-like isoform X2 n=1 Tax=Labrus mixtus TaxID=508554 RepID=UPI0029C0FDE7|nr:adhesion G protein-coupled receptor F5-like isoform X2 [Labrus mixtus]
MGLPKAAACVAVLLVIYYSLDNQEVMETKASYNHSRGKRQVSATQPSATTINVPMDFDLLLDLTIPVSILPLLRNSLNSISFPFTLNQSLQVLDIQFTTACFPNSTGGLQCTCEDQFAWPCDKCDVYGACSNVTRPTCECINGRPSDGEYCEPITSINPCPTPTPVITTTTAMMTTTKEPMDFDLLLDLTIPVSILPLLRNSLNSILFPFTLNQSLQVLDIQFTTACFPNSTGGLQCTCEDQFAWPCDKCDVYGACSNVTRPTCECINGRPSDGEYCEPITSINPCPTPTPVRTTTNTTTMPNTTMPVTTTTMPNTTTMPVTTTTMPLTTTTMPNTTTMPVTTTTMPNTTTMPVTTTTMPNTTTMPVTTTTMPVTTTTMMPVTTTTMMPVTTTTMPNTTTMPVTTTTMPLTTTTMPNTTTMPVTTTTMPNTTTMPVTTTTMPVTTTTMMPVTTTTMPNTTTMPVTTTIMPVTTTTMMPVTTTTTMPVTTTTMMPVTTTINELSFVLDIDFDESFNEESNDVFINANRAIQTQCRTPQSSCQLSGFRSGSTIGDYTIRGASLSDTELQAIQTGIFLDLSETYPIIFDSQSSLKLEPTTVISQQEATVTCGPPPANLNLGTNWTAEWRFNNNPISSNEDLYEFSKVNEEAVLTLKRFFGTDIGQYECRLKSGQKIFRERSNKNFTLQEQPLIRLTPLSRQIHCQDMASVEVKLECSVNEPYTVVLRNSTKVLGTGNSISYSFLIPICEKTEHTFTCQVIGRQEFKQTTLEITTGAPDCNNEVFGTGNLGQMAFGSCERDEVGERKGVCQEDGSWREVENNCILRPVQELLLQSELLNANSLPGFLDTLSDVTVNFTEEVVKSPTNINAIVDILSNVANTSLPINSDLAKDILLTAGVLTTDGARGTWESLNNGSRNESQTRSSTFLQSLENITRRITDVSLAIDTPSILLNKTTFTDSFNASFNSSVTIVISEPGEGEKNITVMTFASMHNVLPARDEANSSRFDINGRVVLVQTSIGNIPINNISFTFNLNNTSLVNPQCVFWNFSLFDDRGGWDNEGCMPVEIKNGSVTCNCNHLTSFSILMSPFVNCEVCSLITFIGVGISMASLVICLIIEAVIWRKIRRNTTSYLRHVSIVNIAMSLLIADIWFIIGASISEAPGDNRDACSAATFFIHFFYLAMFFWMLASALLLLYRTVSVFDGGLSKRSMLAIGFSVGYGGPIIIAVITIAATAPSETYTQGIFCWLNFKESLAIIAFVLPALTIVLFHLIILIVVLFKMLRRRAVADSVQAGQRNVLLVIARTLAVLTPLFGLTWGLGIGTLADPENQGIHIAFSFFNSLQGFFILVFGLLLDKKVRSEIAIKSQISGSGTTSNSAGNSSSAFGFLRLWRRGRDGYNISSNDSNVTQSLNTS